MSELELADRWENINKVAEEFLKGNTNPTLIAKALDMKRIDVIDYLDEWRMVVRSDKQVQIRAREALVGADQHYSMLIKEAWDVVNEAGNTNQLSQKTAALKLISDVQQKQIDMLQKAGMLDNHEMAEKILETETRQEVIVGVIREVVSDCDHCRIEVAERLAKISDKAEAI
jgi:hypothetical protein